MARAAAPMLRGLRGATSTTRRRSDSALGDKEDEFTGGEVQQSSARMSAEMLRAGDSLPLNEKTYPNCYLHRSNPNDVARTEHLTYICSAEKEEAGPTNNWMDPNAAKHKVGALLDGAMRGRTMYVVPYVMGPVMSPISKVGVETTDSPYVVASMRIMSRMGNVAMERLGGSSDLVPGAHWLGG